MNGISLINPHCDYIAAIPIHQIVYFCVISSVTVLDDDAIASNYDLLSLHKRLQEFGESKVSQAVDKLKMKGLLDFRDGEIVVGYVEDGIKKLFEDNKEHDLAKEKEYLEVVLDDFFKVCKKRGKKAFFNSVADLINDTLQKTKFTLQDLTEFYKAIYQVVLQQQHPELTVKEFGQMKNLMKRYDGIIIIKMVIEFVKNSELYVKELPFIGGLLYHKDKVYSAIKKQTKKKEAGFI
jgi:hypothetical protein